MERLQDKPASQRESSELVGPYVLLAEIGRGELTTVYLAKKHGALGFQRLYALKRLKPACSLNADSVELLLDEARLVSGIHHANIAGVLDIGTDAGNYVVMEYVEGENLEQLLLQAGTARHPRFIVPAFVDALHGLHALHTASDADGEPYAIVHQAPRARHIVVGIDGTSRLVDFSQVRGKNVRPTRSRSDRIKVAYMAPEQALHPDGVDLRSDLFIVGVTLWEALTGERLFAADTDEQTFQNMLHRRIPRPSETGLRPPRCFDAICMRALERDPKSRYQSAQEMARDLRDTAINQALYATANELGQWVRQLAGSDLRTLRKLAGQDSPSSSGISLETPAVGLDLSGLHSPQQAGSGLARLSDGLVALPSKGEDTSSAGERKDEDNPYATGRIYGGSRAALEVLPEHARTPAVGFRRDKPLPREEDDDDPTGPRPLPSKVVEARAAAREQNHEARAATRGQDRARPIFDERARAATVPLAAPAAAGGGALARADTDNDETNPAVFVPARPGARRDVNRVSPGSYSQVDGARRQQKSRAPNTELEIPNPKFSPAKEAPAFEEADTTLRAAQVAAGADDKSGTRKARTETKAYVSARSDGEASGKRATPLPSARSGGVTEYPPTYVQRRDSSPTRMEIPAGPVGSPHRPFAPERLSAPAARAARAAHPFDLPLSEGSGGLNAGVLPDSLTPPASASRTAPPDLPPAARPSALWLVSGVLAAIILLALGVGLKQWVAGGPAANAPSAKNAASGRPSTPYEATLRAEPTPAPAAAGAQAAPGPVTGPSADSPTPPTAAAAGPRELAAPARALPIPQAAPKAAKATVVRRSASKIVHPPAAAPEPRPKRESAAPGLPDNPY